ncbi:MAG: hypothetical protein ACWA5P_01235 [bacterium]
MSAISFYSNNDYLFLPSKNAYKVALIVDDSTKAKLSFQLYNPFSTKGKIYKKLMAFLFIHFNRLAKIVFNVKKSERSEFLKHLETNLKMTLEASIYNATAGDKVVLQLLNNDGIYGYLKFPINELGKHNLRKENNGCEILSKNQVVPNLLHSANYKNTPYIISQPLEGTFHIFPDEEILVLLEKFIKNSQHQLTHHPRVEQIINQANAEGLKHLSNRVKQIIQKDPNVYFEAYEHGDFAPWNIIDTPNGLVSFDLEFFEERGIEQFDFIKYHYQIGRLLSKKQPLELAQYVLSKLTNSGSQVLFELFVIKEIIRLHQANESYDYELKILSLLDE